jgi:hypothetical protein
MSSYSEKQKASGIIIGNKVKVLRKAQDHEAGWSDTWAQQMDYTVGKTYKVIEIQQFNGGIRLETCNDVSRNYFYPYFVLEKVEDRVELDPYKTLLKPQEIKDGEKFISMYPHKCPKCQAPAYIGFMDKVDCSRGGCDGIVS